MRPFVILLLLVAASCLSTYPYTFTATATSTYQQPSYPLGYISKDAKVQIILTLPFGGSASALTLAIMDSANQNSVQSLTCSESPCSNTWKATSAGNYYLKASASGAFSQIVTYYLVGIVSGQVSLKVADTMRSKVIKYFYIGQDQSVTLTLSPVSDITNQYITLYSMGSAATNNPSVASTVTIGAPSISSTISTYKVSLTRGFYAAEVTIVVTPSAKVSVQSDNYLCPYSSAYADVYRVFTGCSGEPTNPSPTGPPCAAYDYTALVCQACIPGYALIGGNCFTTSSCGSRQYSNFGNCYDVNPSCDKFDAFTGACVTCVNPNQYLVVNGSCVAKSAICKDGYNAVNGVCVSSACGTSNPSTGACFTCINTAYYLTSGQCLPVYCGEGMYYSANSSKCLNSPTGCFNFSLTYQVCYACSNGTVLSQGVCIQPPNSNNCLIYNLTSSACSTCDRGYYLLNNACTPNPVCGIGEIVINGRCTATQSSCTKNQVFINNQCIYLPDNCEAINTFYQCIRCAPRHQIVSGVCRFCVGSNAYFPCITCGDGNFVNSKGLCQPINPYCASYSTETGKCFNCINGQSPANGNCCDFGYVFQNDSCVKPGNKGGQGGSISLQSKYGKYCKTINPEKQVCTSCLDEHEFDESGRCS